MRQHSSQKLLDKSSASSTSTEPDSANRSMGFQTSAALCIKFFSHSSDGFASGCTNKDQQRTSHILHQNFLARRIFESVINHADSISGINQHLHSLKKAINHSLRTPGLAAEANVSRRAFPPGPEAAFGRILIQGSRPREKHGKIWKDYDVAKAMLLRANTTQATPWWSPPLPSASM